MSVGMPPVMPEIMSPDGMPLSPEQALGAMQRAKVNARRRKVPQPTPEQQRFLEFIRQETDACVVLALKVGTCKCPEKEQCKIFLQGQVIAEIIERIQEVRPDGGNVGKGRTGV